MGKTIWLQIICVDLITCTKKSTIFIKKGHYLQNIIPKMKCWINSEGEEKGLLQETHLRLIHPVIKKHIETTRRYTNIKNAKEKTPEIIKKCNLCRHNKHFKTSGLKTTGHYGSSRPFEKVAMDLKGPIPSHRLDTSSTRDSFYILVFINIFSRFFAKYFLRSIRTADIIKGFKERWLSKNPTPEVLLTDQGR